MSEALVRLRGLVYRYGDLTAVDGIDLEVMRGEMFGLIGPDGAGKTTTLRNALGLLHPESGTVETCGLDPIRQHRELTERLGYLSQRFSLYGDLTVDENIAFFAHVYGVKGWKERRNELLAMVRMTPFRDRLADRLSGGMKQKLALTCTLIHTPELLILDEPTTGVDPVSRRDFWMLLARLQQDGLTLLMTTPYLDEAERCQRVALMHRGKLLAVEDPGTLRADFPQFVVELVAHPRRSAEKLLREDPEISYVEALGERLRAFLPRPPGAAGDPPTERLSERLRSQGIEVSDVRSVRPSLEDVFVAKISAIDQAGAAVPAQQESS
ncbi:MAG: ABC transporter ATP-binding protein [Acidobacteriota bacterium]|jgi:ABC-2 type transport system ATP-binding protein